MLRYIQLFPTFRCNRTCSFCFNRGHAEAGDIGAGDIGRLVAVMADAGVREIDILGGEPTLYPHLETLVGIGRDHGLSFLMSSNGSNIRMLSSLMERFDLRTLGIGVSLNDDVIDAGLSEFIREYRPAIKGVCTRQRPMAGGLASHIDTPGIESWLIFMDTLSEEELADGLSFPAYSDLLSDMQRSHPGLGGVHCGFVMEQLPAGIRCPAGSTKLSVMPDGSVYPCYLLARHVGFRLGNIFTDDLGRMLESPLLDFFRNFGGNACARTECRFHDECRGGCPAISLMVNGSIKTPDPRCGSIRNVR